MDNQEYEVLLADLIADLNKVVLKFAENYKNTKPDDTVYRIIHNAVINFTAFIFGNIMEKDFRESFLELSFKLISKMVSLNIERENNHEN